MIILDLDADAFPIYSSTQSFYGQPFIWCMLHNYGGVQGLYGRISHINKVPWVSRNRAWSAVGSISFSGVYTVQYTDLLFFKIWSQDPMEARNSTGSTMIGVGLSMEGINQNEVMYEFMNEMSWRTHPVDLDEW